MLFGEHPTIVDFDPYHFRNLMELVFPDRTERGRLYVVYEKGQILTGFHTVQGHVRDYTWPSVDDPPMVAHWLLEEFQVDTVALLERTAVDRYFAELQGGHRLGEDMFEFVARGMDLWKQRFADEIVVVPQPLAGFDSARLKAAATALYEMVPDGSHLVLVVFDGDRIWTSVVLGIKGQAIDLVTSLMPLGIAGNGTTEWQQMSSVVVPQVERHFGPVALGLFMQLPAFREMLTSDNWIAWVNEAVAQGRIIVSSSVAQIPAAP